jgi:hypothetical protein
MDPELKDLEARMLQIQVGMEAERVLKIFEGYPYSLQKDQSKPDQVTGIHEHIPKQKLPASPTRFLYFGIRFKDGKVRSKSFFPKSISGWSVPKTEQIMISGNQRIDFLPIIGLLGA